jgi:hypothetical protein
MTVNNIEAVTQDEVEKAIRRIKPKKAAGPDGIPPEAVKIVAGAAIEYITKVFYGILNEGIYPEDWKIAELLLLEKKKATEIESAKFRPICLLDTMGKFFEQILVERLKRELHDKAPLSENQYGFREGRSTVDALEAVKREAERANRRTSRMRNYCALITLDVKNAFNNVTWKNLLEELRRRNVSTYLVRIIGSYLDNRWLRATDKEGKTEQFPIVRGVPQGSILGPVLWNVFYDGVLRLRIPRVKLIGYADDLALVVTGETCLEVEARANSAIQRICGWMEEHHLDLAAEKTEAVMLRGRRRCEPITFEVGGIRVAPKSSIKYLGVRIDENLRYKGHIEEVATRAERTMGNLMRLMPRTDGPRSCKRRILASVGESILLYAAPVWAEDTQYSSRRERLLRVQRRAAVGITSAYRTVSTAAVLVVASMMPIHLQAKERNDRYRSRGDTRQEAIEIWQEEWEGETKGEWTRRLIPHLRPWVARKFGDLRYELTQALTGHGCFGSFLFKLNKRDNPNCMYCDEIDTPEHTLFRCERWSAVRERCAYRQDLCVERMVGKMLVSPEHWIEISNTIIEIIRTKEKEVRVRG